VVFRGGLSKASDNCSSQLSALRAVRYGSDYRRHRYQVGGSFIASLERELIPAFFRQLTWYHEFQGYSYLCLFHPRPFHVVLICFIPLAI
jgi:hypothetical protein